MIPSFRQGLINSSAFKGKYDQSVDRESAYELLQQKYAREQKLAAEAEEDEKQRKAQKSRERERDDYDRPARRGRKPDTMLEKIGKTAISTVGTQFTRQLVRGILGSLLRK